MELESRRVYTGGSCGSTSTQCDSPMLRGELEIIATRRRRHRALRSDPQGDPDPTILMIRQYRYAAAGGPLWKSRPARSTRAKSPKRAPGASCSKRRGSLPVAAAADLDLDHAGASPTRSSTSTWPRSGSRRDLPIARARRVHRGRATAAVAGPGAHPGRRGPGRKDRCGILYMAGFVLGCSNPLSATRTDVSARLNAGLVKLRRTEGYVGDATGTDLLPFLFFFFPFFFFPPLFPVVVVREIRNRSHSPT